MAKKNKKTDLASLSDKDLQKELSSVNKNYTREMARGRLSNQTTALRRELARLQTELTRRQKQNS